MSSIGTYTFVRLEGAKLPAKAMTTAIIDRPGVDGIGFRYNALKLGQQTVESVEAITYWANAVTRPDDYAALKGTLVSVIDDMGRRVDNVLVGEVIVTAMQQVYNATGGANYIVRATWVLQPTG